MKKSQTQQPLNLLENLRKVITLVDQLRDIGLNKYIQLPRIAVLGIQSSGKSSLLEQIVGIDFLPRGDGVVTRRPLELRLQYTPKNLAPVPYAIFEEIKGKKFTDFAEVKQNIITLTDKIAGSKKNIVDIPIILSVFGPNCPDLTLVDLPGITRIPLAGSGQPENIEEITTNMAKKYCADPSTIILCVVAANQDLTTSDALLLAKKLDPSGERTFGVLTKIDIMDRGTNALRMLKGQDVTLKYGYVGVKLRSQQDIKDNITVQKALQQEKEFFASHPVYSSVPGEIFGTQVLTQKLTTILYRHIRSFLPKLMTELTGRLTEAEKELTKLGPGLPTEDKDKLHYVWQLINEFTMRFKNSISGSYEKSAFKSLEPAGARVRENFSALYKEYEAQEFRVLKDYRDEEIQQIIYKYEGDNIPGFLSVDAFYALLNPQLKSLYGPAKDCVDDTFQILEDYAGRILEEQLGKLPEIKQLIQDQVLNVLHQAQDQAQQSVEELLDAEINYIFTNDFQFLTGQHQQFSGTEKQQQEALKSNPLVYELKRKIEHYFKIVLRTIRDNLPKLIGHFLVKGAQNNMLLHLQENIMQNQEYLNIVNEPANIVEERQRLKKEVETLKAAQKVIKRDPDLSDYILKLSKEQEEDQMTQSSSYQESRPNEQAPSKPSASSLFKNQEKPIQPQQQEEVQQFRPSPPKVDDRKKQEPQTLQQRISQKVTETQPQVQQPTPGLFNQQAQSQNQQQGKGGLFGNQIKAPEQAKQQETTIQQQQNSNVNPLQKQNVPLTQKAAQQYNSTVDKGVDKAMEDPRVQEGMKNAAKQSANAAVKQAMPGAPTFVTQAAEKAAEKTVQSQAFQEAVKDGVKNELKTDEKNPGAGAKAGLFGFLKKPQQ